MAAGIAVIATVAGTDTAEIAADPDTADPVTVDPVTAVVDSTAAATVVDSAAVVTAVDLVVAATVVGSVAAVTAADSVAAAVVVTWVAAAVVVTGKFSSLPSSNKRHVCFGRRAFFHWSKASALPPCAEHPIFCADLHKKRENTARVSY
jgi:hypothetical protein